MHKIKVEVGGIFGNEIHGISTLIRLTRINGQYFKIGCRKDKDSKPFDAAKLNKEDIEELIKFLKETLEDDKNEQSNLE